MTPPTSQPPRMPTILDSVESIDHFVAELYDRLLAHLQAGGVTTVMHPAEITPELVATGEVVWKVHPLRLDATTAVDPQ